MEGGQVVVDASVVVKWFIVEEYSSEARLLRDAYVEGLIDLAAPELLPFEVLNALRYSGAFGEDELKEVARVLDDFQLALFRLEGELALRAVEVAMRKGVTIYDASYVALAELLGATLYTADEKLIRKTRDLGVVKHVSEFQV
ncbi:hypothetical protein Pyrde_1850 [Pyrodictium delaneyi]|uniref:Ribonuclease VapC n=1 Tax=Pyrodictium delaneyi TaxID=1273541 RepID=A0A0P0N568_9CREN|nr:type II toxin-antitoxin system VapC family toxin [Pyrodictium delaneyi]ALL01893.1 hypothetical protein Pyrde_1850 [Pyrodictium delaneyi]